MSSCSKLAADCANWRADSANAAAIWKWAGCSWPKCTLTSTLTTPEAMVIRLDGRDEASWLDGREEDRDSIEREEGAEWRGDSAAVIAVT